MIFPRLPIFAALLVAVSGCGSGADSTDAAGDTGRSGADAGTTDAGSAQGFTAHYFTAWAAPYIHFDDGSGWTPPPGKPMKPEGGMWFVYNHPVWRGSVTVAFNDGADNWDNHGGENYTSTVREFWVKDGTVFDKKPGDATDGGTDTSPDAAVDTGDDGSGDAEIDAGSDAGDSGADAGTDAGPYDAGQNPVSKSSWRVLPSANGIGTLLFDGDPANAKVTTYYPHIYRRFDAASGETPNLLYDMYFGVRAAGANRWLNTVAPSQMRYLPGTGVVEVTRAHAGLSITEYYWVAMGADFPVAVAGIKIKNTTASVISGVSAFALGNFHVGTGATQVQNEKADYDPTFNGFFERNALLASYYNVVFSSGAPPDAKAASTGDYDPWQEVEQGRVLADRLSSQRDDLALFFQKDLGTLSPGAEASYYVAWNTVRDSDRGPIAAPITALIGGRTLQDLLDAETIDWDTWHSGASLPAGITAEERALAEQSAAFIRMAQVREETGGKGQILASLPPGGWNIAWVRDMSYAIVGMARAGHFDVAKEALTFIFERAQAGTYIDPKWGIGKPYRVSVCRYYGNGAEESDVNSAGPNIEFDGFGLALWALEEYVRASGDTAFLNMHEAAIFGGTADIITGLYYGPLDLIQPDSSIWELHVVDDGYNGRRHFTYTGATALRGLYAAAYLARQAGMAVEPYTATADTRKPIFLNWHVDASDVLVNFPPQDRSPKPPENGVNDFNVDASVVEAFNFGIIDPVSAIADATLAAFDRELGGLASGSPGLKRTNKRCPPGFGGCVQIGADWYNTYDIKEWIFVDFRFLQFLRKRPDPVSQARATRLNEWILAQTAANYGEIAELYDEATAEYRGSVPMCGFGPGAYLIDLTSR